jgi:SNF2 family DNA or RNA helicase
MAILHGTWLFQASPNAVSSGGGLLLWGEVWRKVALGNDRSATTLQANPFSMTPAELWESLQNWQQTYRLQVPDAAISIGGDRPAKSAKRTRQKSDAIEQTVEFSSDRWPTYTLAMPSTLVAGDEATSTPAIVLPLLTGTTTADTPDPVLHPWQVTGLYLAPEAAMAFLNSLPLGEVSDDESFVGGDLRFWCHVARWSLDLLARGKFLPGLVEGELQAAWHPLLDSEVDQARLVQFRDRMPAACRAGQLAATLGSLAIDLPPVASTLLQTVLQQLLDAQIRRAIATQDIALPGGTSAATIWLQALSHEATVVSPEVAKGVRSAVEMWMTPLQGQRTENRFRTCLQLHPPAAKRTDWRLDFGLQATDDPAFLIDAATIWNNPIERLNYRGRIISQPQETFLMGLGLASRLYAPIEPSLQTARPQSCTLTPLQAYDFLKNVAWRLQDSGIGVVVPPSLASQGGWANRLGLKIQAQTGKLKPGQRLGLQSLLNFRWELTIGGQSISKDEFNRLVALNSPLVEINGEWVELRPQDVKAAQTFFATRKDQPTLSLEDALRISSGDTQMLEKLPVVSFEAAGGLQDLINTLTGKRTLEAIATPTGFQGELRPYQSRGVGWLAFLEQWGLGACLADDMGLGKTIQLIAFLLHLQEHKSLDAPTLLICPTSVLGNWEREVKKFGPLLKTVMHHGDQRPKGKDLVKALRDKHLVITSYALVQRDLADLQQIGWQGVVLDEAQNIKNPEAKQSKAVRELSAQFRIALTGTPVENRLSELWSIMDFLNPGYLGPRNFFQRRFATPIERYGDTDSLKTLRSLVQPFILRRLKTDRDIIQDLPEKQEMTVFCGLTSEQAALYQRLVDESLAKIDASEGIQRHGIILALLTKLKQICNHPDLYLKEAENGRLGGTTPFQTRSGKLQRLEEMLDEVLAEGDRALIFTQFAEWGKLLKTFLEKQLGRETLFLYGGTSKAQREEMVDRFQQDPQAPRLFILSLKAGGVGLNLTRANHVFHFDRWWNPAVENQATDRVFRIGQRRDVQVHKFVCSGTLEEKIHDLIESKKSLAEQVVGAGENWLTELDTDQLRDLLLLDRNAIIGE